TGTTNGADRYTINFDVAAEGAGFNDVTDQAFAAPAAIVITIPGSATAATYNADLTVSNSVTGCVSSAVTSFQIIINPSVSVTPGPNVAVCSGTTTVDFTFAGITGGADTYSLLFDAI